MADLLDNVMQRQWAALLEKDDRTSPGDYPDMVLITRDELCDAMREAAELGSFWPDIRTLIFPRDPAGRDADPVLAALQAASRPWVLDPIFRELRRRGAPIPTKAEAEYAAALHFLVGLALKHGADWADHVVDEIRAFGPEPV